MRETIDILGIPVDCVTMEEAKVKFSEYINSQNYHMVFTPNPEIIMIAQENKTMKEALQAADLVIPDGIGVVIGSKLLKGKTLTERVPGFDLTQETMAQAVDKGYRYYFFGGKPGVAEEAAAKMRLKYPGIQIVGTRDGYFKEEENPSIIEAINASGANVLFVALGAPKQELWIQQAKTQLPHIRVAMGVGGSLDVMAGTVKRAPEIYQKLNLEWFYRLVTQPTRAKRMLLLPKFIVEVIKVRNK